MSVSYDQTPFSPEYENGPRRVQRLRNVSVIPIGGCGGFGIAADCASVLRFQRKSCLGPGIASSFLWPIRASAVFGVNCRLPNPHVRHVWTYRSVLPGRTTAFLFPIFKVFSSSHHRSGIIACFEVDMLGESSLCSCPVGSIEDSMRESSSSFSDLTMFCFARYSSSFLSLYWES